MFTGNSRMLVLGADDAPLPPLKPLSGGARVRKPTGSMVLTPSLRDSHMQYLACALPRRESQLVLESLRIKDFTAFTEADLTFATGLNIIVGANGTGKSHLLKLPYAPMAMSAEEGKKRSASPTKTLVQNRIAEKIIGVFRPEERLGRLVHRQKGRKKCEVEMRFGQPKEAYLAFSFSSVAQSKVSVTSFPSGWQDKLPVFLPMRELLTLYPGFVSLYETHPWNFDETWCRR